MTPDLASNTIKDVNENFISWLLNDNKTVMLAKQWLTELLLKLHWMSCKLNVYKQLQESLREVGWGNLML